MRKKCWQIWENMDKYGLWSTTSPTPSKVRRLGDEGDLEGSRHFKSCLQGWLKGQGGGAPPPWEIGFAHFEGSVRQQVSSPGTWSGRGFFFRSTPVSESPLGTWKRPILTSAASDKKFPRGGATHRATYPPIPKHIFLYKFLIKIVLPEALRWICLGRSTWPGLPQWSSSTCSSSG